MAQRFFASLVLMLVLAACGFADETVEVRVHFDRGTGQLVFTPSQQIKLSLNDVVTIKTRAVRNPIIIDTWEATEEVTDRQKRGKTTVETTTYTPYQRHVFGQLGSQIRIQSVFGKNTKNGAELQSETTVKIDQAEETLTFGGTVDRTQPYMAPLRGRWTPGREPHRVGGSGTEHWYTITVTIKR